MVKSSLVLASERYVKENKDYVVLTEEVELNTSQNNQNYLSGDSTNGSIQFKVRAKSNQMNITNLKVVNSKF